MTRVVDVPEIKKIKKSIVINKYVDRPVEVIREIERPVVRKTERIVEHPVYYDKIVEVPRERIVEKPVYFEKRVDVPYEVTVDKEIFIDKIVEVEVPQYIEKPVTIQR